MSSFRDVSIQRKQTLILLLTSTAALLLACAGFVTFDLLTFRDEIKHNLLGVAKRVADQNTAPLELKDPTYAKVSSIVDDEKNIIAAVIYDKDGEVFAKYRADGNTRDYAPPPPGIEGARFENKVLTLFHSVLSNDGVRIGTVYLESDLRSLYERLKRYAGIVASLFFVSLLFALLLSSRLQRLISGPILHLVATAKTISQEKNYSVRATKTSGDELGLLIDAFNAMLGQIQERDVALQQAHDDLEKRVADRTRELQLEIIERKQAEEGLQQQLTRISLLNQITQAISERQDLQSIVQVVLRELQDHLSADFGAVLLHDEAAQILKVASYRCKDPAAAHAVAFVENAIITRAQAGLCECIKGQTVYIRDSATNDVDLMQKIARGGLRSVVAVPLLVESRTIGILLTARRKVDDFSSRECEFLRVLSEQVALAAHQARLYSELQDAYNELRQTQQAVMQQERLRALGKMASGIAHDINNALSPIVVYSDLLLRSEQNLNDRTRKYLNHVKTAGEDIAHIVARMREFYRRREETEAVTPLNLNELAQQVIELTRPRWRDIPQERGIVIDMRTDLDPSLPEVTGHASELREALTNLILNAVDAMAAGGTLTLRTRVRDWKGQKRKATHVFVEVEDTGIGMDEETCNRCLEPFFSTKGQRGTGLGLAMVYGVMERHEGSIEINSHLGKGTTMRLVFPIRERINSPDTQIHEKPPELIPLRILCIDDEPLLRELLQELLTGEGHFVTAADGGQNGLDAFRAASKSAEPFDVVITDLGMPYVDGRQVAATIKRESPITPVIMLTGWGSMMKSDGEMPSQVDAVLSKPPRMTELRATLLRVTQRAPIAAI
jgi:signal transduction histidine kinase/ActR/RegA family two-component response regulator